MLMNKCLSKAAEGNNHCSDSAAEAMALSILLTEDPVEVESSLDHGVLTDADAVAAVPKSNTDSAAGASRSPWVPGCNRAAEGAPWLGLRCCLAFERRPPLRAERWY